MHLHGSHQITSGLDSVGMLKVRKYLLKDSIEVALVAFYTVQKYVSNAFLELLVIGKLPEIERDLLVNFGNRNAPFFNQSIPKCPPNIFCRGTYFCAVDWKQNTGNPQVVLIATNIIILF